ncbi:MAG TPA: polysaccharide pyruvyl transferase family protein [Povalibacter sp.]|nr:polysaccharide pyruvyl transferase family protein [Povalibacter sp.]
MKVFYHKTVGGNVGDDMNAVIWHRIVPELDRIDCADWLVGAGTILDKRINELPGRKVIMGTGFRPGRTISADEDIHFAAVRGFLTAEHCGLSRDVAVCDPGFAVGRLWPTTRQPSQRVAFVPHVYSEQYSQICAAAADAGFEVISPTLSLEEFLDRLAGCARAYCESLHGAIFADALRRPWARVRVCSSHYEGTGVADFKWTDTFSVFGQPSTCVNRTVLLPVKRSWPLMQSGLRPLQAWREKRLINELRQRSDDASAFRLTDVGRLEERADELIARVRRLRDSDAGNMWQMISATQLAATSAGATR